MLFWILASAEMTCFYYSALPSPPPFNRPCRGSDLKLFPVFTCFRHHFHLGTICPYVCGEFGIPLPSLAPQSQWGASIFKPLHFVTVSHFVIPNPALAGEESLRGCEWKERANPGFKGFLLPVGRRNDSRAY
jgi:hypothetical protein